MLSWLDLAHCCVTLLHVLTNTTPQTARVVVGGGGGGSEGPKMMKRGLRKFFVPLMANGKFRCRSRQSFFWGAKSGPESRKKLSFIKCHEAHQIDKRNVPNRKMYMLAVKNYFI